MNGTPLPDKDHVARYCKPSTVDLGMPMALAFVPKEDEDYSSVNWVEFLNAPDVATAVQQIRQIFSKKGYALRRNGRFAVMNVGDAKTAVREGVSHSLRIEHLPLQNDQSHAGIFRSNVDDFAVAAELAALVAPQDVYPAVSA